METEGGGQVPPESYDPTKIKPITKFVALNPVDIVSDLGHAKSSNKNDEKLKYLASGIEGLDLLLESNLWTVEASVVNKANTIRTLPHVSGGEQELISAIQPAAWREDLPGGLYDPINDRISKNVVGHWQGRASSLKQFLLQSITTPCFMAFHVIAIIGVIIAFAIAFTNDKISNDASYKNQTLAIIISIALGYDLLSCAVIFILEAFFPDDPDPFEATKVQAIADHFVGQQLESLVDNIPQEQKLTLDSEGEKTKTQLASSYVLTYFYDPGQAALRQVLKMGGIFHKAKAATFEWSKYEDLLAVFRFVREISDSDVTKASSVEKYDALDDTTKRNMYASIAAGLVKGNDEVAEQLARMLAGALIPAARRREAVESDHGAVSLRHIVGGSGVREIVSEVRKELKNTKGVRNALIKAALANDAGEELVSFHTHSTYRQEYA